MAHRRTRHSTHDDSREYDRLQDDRAQRDVRGMDLFVFILLSESLSEVYMRINLVLILRFRLVGRFGLRVKSRVWRGVHKCVDGVKREGANL